MHLVNLSGGDTDISNLLIVLFSKFLPKQLHVFIIVGLVMRSGESWRHFEDIDEMMPEFDQFC